jgi:hypothetical protein
MNATTYKLTAHKLRRFAAIRNKSDLNTNMQFGFDAQQAGFPVSDLGPALKQPNGNYVWQTPFGDLIEDYSAPLGQQYRINDATKEN